MKNTLLYLITVLIWGTTWIAIEYQINVVAVEVSLFFRFAIASIIMLMFSIWRKLPLSFNLKDHAFIFALAMMNFSINYLILYEAQKYLTSAMTSIAFSTLLLVNIVNTRIFFGTQIKPKVYIGAIIGLAGIAMLFYPTIAAQNYGSEALTGLVLTLAGTLVASFGNMISVRNSRNGISILSANTWGMLYGTIIMLSIISFTGIDITIPVNTSYWISLSYLSVFGTVIAFASYFMLMNNIGPEKASYVIVLFPVIAIFISIFVEDFQLTELVIGGFLLVALGNLIVLTPTEKLRFRKQRITKASECIDC